MPLNTRVCFTSEPIPSSWPSLVLVGSSASLSSNDFLSALPENVPRGIVSSVIATLTPSMSSGASTSLWVEVDGSARQIVVCCVSTVASRHNTPVRSDQIRSLVGNTPERDAILAVALTDVKYTLAVGVAAGSIFPQYTDKTGDAKDRTVTIKMVAVGHSDNIDVGLLQRTTDSARLAAALVDKPPCKMDTLGMLAEAEKVAAEVGCKLEAIKGEELKQRGFGGLYGVGKAAENPPVLCILSHTPEGAKKNIVLAGKGIIYDTGGLSIKDKVSMPGMKRDMGGSAGVLGAFRTLALGGFKDNLYALLCLADNAVGPLAARPDDVHHMYSGKTVEINNTDAEGRLVLADGVAYAAKHLNPDVILDMATLTGAQGISTGRKHGAVMTNSEEWEQKAVRDGKLSGDLTFPILYCPELLSKEFASAVADMKNSVKDRSNAQSSCAGQFIANHIPSTYEGVHIHIDMAYPSFCGERATGYGVALLVQMFSS